MTASLTITLERACWNVNALIENLELTDALTGELRHIREDHFEHDGAIDDLVTGDTIQRSYADPDSSVPLTFRIEV